MHLLLFLFELHMAFVEGTKQCVFDLFPAVGLTTYCCWGTGVLSNGRLGKQAMHSIVDGMPSLSPDQTGDHTHGNA